MPTLPTVTYGDSAKLQSAPSAPASQAGVILGDAVSQFGNQMLDMAVRHKQAEDKSNYNKARNELILLDLETRRKVENEYDYKDWESAHRDIFSTASKKIIGGLRVARDRELLQGVANIDAEQSMGVLAGRAQVEDVRVNRAIVTKDIQTIMQMVDEVGSHGDFMKTSAALNTSINDAIEAGYYPDDEGELLRQRISGKMAELFLSKQEKKAGWEALNNSSASPQMNEIAKMIDPLRQQQLSDAWLAEYEIEVIERQSNQIYLALHDKPGMTYGDGLDEIHRQTRNNPKTRKAALNMWRQDQGDKVLASASLAGEIAKDMEAGVYWTAPQKDLDALTPQDAEFLRTKQERGDFPTYTDEVWKTAKMIGYENEYGETVTGWNEMTVKEMADEIVNLIGYQDKMTRQDWQTFRDEVVAARDIISGGKQDLKMDPTNFATAKTSFTTRMDDLLSSISDETAHKGIKRKLETEFRKQWDATKARMGGGLVGDDEIEKTLNATFRMAVIEKGGWNLFGPDAIEIPVALLTVDDFDFEDIPLALRQQYMPQQGDIFPMILLSQTQAKNEYLTHLQDMDTSAGPRYAIPFTAGDVNTNTSQYKQFRAKWHKAGLPEDEAAAGYADHLNELVDQDKDRVMQSVYENRYLSGTQVPTASPRAAYKWSGVLREHEDKPFVKRILYPERYRGVSMAVEGGIASHLMAAEVDENGQWYVFPTVVMNLDAEGNLVDTPGVPKVRRFDDPFEALEYNIGIGNVIPFDNADDAIEFSKEYKTSKFIRSYQGR